MKRGTSIGRYLARLILLKFSSYVPSIFFNSIQSSSFNMIAFENSGSDVQAKVDGLRASFATEKLKHITHRRHEISMLYRGLQDDMEPICKAIASEGLCSAAAAEAEFRLTMDGIRKFYHALKTPNTKVQLRGAQRDGTRRLAMGIVAIRPASHSRLYSTMIPLIAAIAAGNCVLLEVSFLNLKKEISYRG